MRTFGRDCWRATSWRGAAAALAAEIGEAALLFALDVTDQPKVEAMVAFAEERFGPLHLAAPSA